MPDPNFLPELHVKRLFVGGPWHGLVRAVQGDRVALTIVSPDESDMSIYDMTVPRAVTPGYAYTYYEARKLQLGNSHMTVFMTSREMAGLQIRGWELRLVVAALVKAAGLPDEDWNKNEDV